MEDFWNVANHDTRHGNTPFVYPQQNDIKMLASYIHRLNPSLGGGHDP